ncbi:hypothetical protein pb186bvf_006258 [Paramecium bursaria]
MDDLLECTKCGTEVDQILALQCEHNLCLNCSAKLFGKSSNQQLICEICGTNTVLDPSAIEVLSDMQQMQQSRISMKQSKISSNNNICCQQHPSEEALLYCYSCETPCFCMECYLSGLHKNHEVRNVQKTYLQLKGTKAEQIFQKVKAGQEFLLTDQCKFTAKKRELMEISASTRMQIQQNFQDLYRALQLKEAELIQVAEETIADKIKEIDNEVQRIHKDMDKLSEILQDMNQYFTDSPDATQAIQAFNFVAYNNRRIEQITRQIVQERENNGPQFQFHYTLDPQSIIQQIDDIRATKIKITSLRGLESSDPTPAERSLYERAREERTKRLFQLPQQVDKENSFSSNNVNLTEFERRLQEAKRTLTNRQK